MIKMDLRSKKKLAARTFGVGLNRIAFNNDRLEDINEAITKRDIKGLVISKAITIKGVQGSSKYRLRKRLLQKRKGRQQGPGSREGKRRARLSRKREWINRIRKQRKYLISLKRLGIIKNDDFRTAYKKSGGGFFRSKRHIRMYLEENRMIRKNDAEKEKGREDGL